MDSFTYVVQVDFWENQRFKPLQGGWAGGVPLYSDLSATRSVNPEVFSNDDIGLPKGWEWAEEEWKPDTSEHFGQADRDGWSYAAKFETLIKQCYCKELKSERSTSNIARRRRWIRTRMCVDLEATKIEKSRVSQMQEIHKRVSNVIRAFKYIDSQVANYHEHWSSSVESVISAAATTQSEVFVRADFMAQRLYQLKTFLNDLGEVEARYASGLQFISQKWSQPQLIDKENKPLYDKYVSNEERSFFRIVGANQDALADRKLSLARLLKEHLPAGKNIP
jgi:hypothetical protein